MKTIENLKQHFILRAAVNSATALQMAQHIWSHEGAVHHSISELVTVINTASLSLKRVCESINYGSHNEPDK